jgi:hypothetical protein
MAIGRARIEKALQRPVVHLDYPDATRSRPALANSRSDAATAMWNGFRRIDAA